ncbi:Nitric oxide -responding transcriptional regulator NnrR (Crp/Fnr family) [Rubellimicrobium mesophilum DSM 19309]|uniref:Nitric oxide-responding transcriptional regulator NnrR (Crp/Fnr family) n=1 Tax=Rubellimicrobium mesophilum DSM 19309 TaxID=442562 RepID=A0A017HU16_9RHOB|nr:Crp/Fnr family transcriptional regulator [Rubellimicrobium mesophilum]EYD77244.1 Nitric oxide -responding transcriptional regulator NnrR (Crp/Fnr family) [Rubellimicrobium mesophilum DSM 19309]
MNKLDESLLTGLPPFSRLERPQIREILDQATPKRHDEGAEVFREGEEADRFFLLLDGYVRVVRTTPTGDQMVLRHIAPGQLIGIAPALGRTTYPATATAASEALTLAWPTRLWPGFVTRYEGFATETWATLGRRMQELNDHLAELATKAVEQRVASAVLRMVNQTGRKVDGGIEIAFPVTRANIAEMTGTTLHTVSRLLAAWEKDGIVESRRKHIVVTAPHRLVLLSGAGG